MTPSDAVRSLVRDLLIETGAFGGGGGASRAPMHLQVGSLRGGFSRRRLGYRETTASNHRGDRMHSGSSSGGGNGGEMHLDLRV
jgi:hypothetical protein